MEAVSIFTQRNTQKVYLCTHRKRYGKDSCNCLPVKVDDVYAAVLAVIKEQIQVFVDREMILKEHHNDSRVIRQEQVYTEAVNKCVKGNGQAYGIKERLVCRLHRRTA